MEIALATAAPEEVSFALLKLVSITFKLNINNDNNWDMPLGYSKGSTSLSLLPTFLSLLSARHEYNYDILVWALQHYFCSRFHNGMHPFGLRVWNLLQENEGEEYEEEEPRSAATIGNGDDREQRRHEIDFAWVHEMKERYDEAAAGSTLVELPNDVKLYLEALIKHTRASPAMIRYGAALSLFATIRIYGPVVFDKVPEVINAIISGCLDSHHLVSSLYLEMMNITAKLRGVEVVERMTSARLRRFRLLPIVDSLDDDEGASGHSKTKGVWRETDSTPSRHAVATAALSLSPGLDSAFMLSLSAPLPFMTRNGQIAQMRLIEVWLGTKGLYQDDKAPAVSGDFVQNILPHLRSADPEVQERAVAIFQKMAPWMEEVGQMAFFGFLRNIYSVSFA